MNNVPIIIFDGPDNVGKGTQIKLLRKQFSNTAFAITNLDKPIGETLEGKEWYGLEAIRNQLATIHGGHHRKVPQIADRAQYSEYAYSILRNAHNLKTIIEIENDYEEMKASVLGIVFVDSPENISARDDGKSNYDKEDLEGIKNIVDRFVEISEASIFDVEVINISGKDVQAVQQEVNALVTEKFPNLS